MIDADRVGLVQIGEFLSGSREIRFEMNSSEERRRLICRVLQHTQYRGLGKKEKGQVRQYLIRLTGLKRAQLTRLIRQWNRTGAIVGGEPRRPRFVRRYSRADIALLVEVDEAHEQLSGAAVRRILAREYEVYGRAEFERLSRISVSHLYNLRQTKLYRERRLAIEPTRSVANSFAERRKPEPKGEPGYLRVDTVHQGRVREQDGKMWHGIYHINAVDTVTQWEILGCCQELSRTQLEPLLRSMMEQYPFRIQGFHCDNGSEFLNHKVAQMLDELRIEFTKSRAYRTTDNALVEGKNGSVVRKHMGYGMFRQGATQPINDFYREHLNPYLNFHRPCGFATITTDARGRRRRRYPASEYATPYEKLRSLSRWQRFLKPEVTAKSLERRASLTSDTEAAQAMQQAKAKLYRDTVPQPAGVAGQVA